MLLRFPPDLVHLVTLFFKIYQFKVKKKIASYVKMLSDKSGFYVETRTLIAYFNWKFGKSQ